MTRGANSIYMVIWLIGGKWTRWISLVRVHAVSSIRFVHRGLQE